MVEKIEYFCATFEGVVLPFFKFKRESGFVDSFYIELELKLTYLFIKEIIDSDGIQA